MHEGFDSAPLRVGTAGWDYPDWDGIVYPRERRGGFDKLRWLTRFVDVIEINSTFYRPARPAVAAGWARRVEDRPRFLFTAKAHRSWSHDPPHDLDAGVAATLAGLAPLRDAGRLGAVLVQFPQSFRPTAANRDRLERLAETAEGWPLVVELRHREWDRDEIEEALARLGLGWCAIDQPRASPACIGVSARRTTGVGYLRLHGRNRARWFDASAGRDERYDYRYRREELARLAGAVRRLADGAHEVFVVQNNHFRGQALADALQFRSLFEGDPPAAPQELVERYADLRDVVAAQRTKLF